MDCMQNDKQSDCRTARQFITETPSKAVGTALGAGLLLSLLPVGRIVGMLVDVGFAMARPILIGVGVYKVSEACRSLFFADGAAAPKQPNPKTKQ